MPIHQDWNLAATPESVPAARHHVVDALRAEGWADHLVDEAALLTTELATNAVVHTHGPYTMTMDLTSDCVRIDLRDGNTTVPVPSPVAPLSAFGGRGLFFLATLATSWGIDPLPAGKSVWFELHSPDEDAPPGGA